MYTVSYGLSDIDMYMYTVSYGLSDIDMPGVKTMCFSSV